jgi:hypothetical protein
MEGLVLFVQTPGPQGGGIDGLKGVFGNNQVVHQDDVDRA